MPKGRKPRASRTEELTRIEDRRVKIAELYLQGYTAFPISKIIGVAERTVNDDLDIVRKEWMQNRLVDYDIKMERETRALDLQESELWKAWYRSCEVETISKKRTKRKLINKTIGKGKDKVVTSEMVTIAEDDETVTRQMIGDPRFMAEITKVRELRCKLQGLLEDERPDAPIINIWQQLQEMKFDRDADPIEDRINQVRMLPPSPLDTSGIKGHPLDRKEPIKGSHIHTEDDSDLEPPQADDGSPLGNGFKELPKDDTPLDIPDE